MLVDSHCHLNFPDFKDDLDEVISRAREMGVTAMQTICTDLAEFDEVHAIAQKYDHIYCSVGVHPNEAGNTEIARTEDLVTRASSPKVIGIGETGLDYYYENSPREAQQQSFRSHIRAARQTGLPLIIHTRSAEEDTARILEEEMEQGAFGGVLHCFTSSRILAEKAIALGFYISFSGIISFKNAADLRETAKVLPLDKLLVETDAPYLAPIPHRGKRNEPAFTYYTNKLLAELKDISEAECAAATTQNFYRLFSKAARIAP